MRARGASQSDCQPHALHEPARMPVAQSEHPEPEQAGELRTYVRQPSKGESATKKQAELVSCYLGKWDYTIGEAPLTSRTESA